MRPHVILMLIWQCQNSRRYLVKYKLGAFCKGKFASLRSDLLFSRVAHLYIYLCTQICFLYPPCWIQWKAISSQSDCSPRFVEQRKRRYIIPGVYAGVYMQACRIAGMQNCRHCRHAGIAWLKLRILVWLATSSAGKRGLGMVGQKNPA